MKNHQSQWASRSNGGGKNASIALQTHNGAVEPSNGQRSWGLWWLHVFKELTFSEGGGVMSLFVCIAKASLAEDTRSCLARGHVDHVLQTAETTAVTQARLGVAGQQSPFAPNFILFACLFAPSVLSVCTLLCVRVRVRALPWGAVCAPPPRSRPLPKRSRRRRATPPAPSDLRQTSATWSCSLASAFMCKPASTHAYTRTHAQTHKSSDGHWNVVDSTVVPCCCARKERALHHVKVSSCFVKITHFYMIYFWLFFFLRCYEIPNKRLSQNYVIVL